jgi:hypothetical protein
LSFKTDHRISGKYSEGEKMNKMVGIVLLATTVFLLLGAGVVSASEWAGGYPGVSLNQLCWMARVCVEEWWGTGPYSVAAGYVPDPMCIQMNNEEIYSAFTFWLYECQP